MMTGVLQCNTSDFPGGSLDEFAWNGGSGFDAVAKLDKTRPLSVLADVGRSITIPSTAC